MEDETEIQDTTALAAQVTALEATVKSLSDAFYHNNFVSTQDFQKDSSFNTTLKIPHYNSIPSTCNVGQIIESSGKLYICSAVNTFTLAGSQS